MSLNFVSFWMNHPLHKNYDGINAIDQYTNPTYTYRKFTSSERIRGIVIDTYG